MKKTLLLLCSALIAVTVFAASFASDEQSLRKLDRDMALATYMGDSEWFRVHLTDDYIRITSGGAIQTKAELIDRVHKNDLKMTPFETSGVVIRAHGNTAIVTGRMIQKYTAAGKRVTADLRYSDVWIKTEEGWFLVSSQLSPIAAVKE